MPLGRQVVVVAVEAPVGKGQPSGEIVQLGKGHVADQMCPEPVPVRPHRRVDEDGHIVQRKTRPQWVSELPPAVEKTSRARWAGHRGIAIHTSGCTESMSTTLAEPFGAFP